MSFKVTVILTDEFGTGNTSAGDVFSREGFRKRVTVWAKYAEVTQHAISAVSIHMV